MNPLVQIADLVIPVAFNLFITLVWLRFLLQLVRADFYDPFAQYVVKVTKPVLHPLRRIIPGVAGMDMAALLLILLLRGVQLGLMHVIDNTPTSPLDLFIVALYTLLLDASTFYFWLLIVRVVLSWIAQGNNSPGMVLVYQLTEPLMAPCRRLLPAMGPLDLSIILVFLGLRVYEILVNYAFQQLLGFIG